MAAGLQLAPGENREVRQGSHRYIESEFGHMPLSEVRPSQVKAWVAQLYADGLADSIVHEIHKRLSQILSDAVHDDLLGANPCSRRTSPSVGPAPSEQFPESEAESPQLPN